MRARPRAGRVARSSLPLARRVGSWPDGWAARAIVAACGRTEEGHPFGHPTRYRWAAYAATQRRGSAATDGSARHVARLPPRLSAVRGRLGDRGHGRTGRGGQAGRDDVARRGGQGAPAGRDPTGRPWRHARSDGHRRAGRRRWAGPPGCSPTDRRRQGVPGHDPARAVHRDRRRRGRGGGGRRRAGRSATRRSGPAWRVDRRDRPGAQRGERHQDRRASGRTSGCARASRWCSPPAGCTMSELDRAWRCGATPGCIDVDVDVACSAGTYMRAIARDLGVALGVGGHLTALRRTRGRRRSPSPRR